MAETRTRLTNDQRMMALAMLARGDTLSQVSAHLLEEFGIKISESALSQLRKAQSNVIAKMRDTMAEHHTADAEDLLRRSRRLISKKLDKAERDSNELEELDRQYRDGTLKDHKEYRRRKAGLLQVSIAELNQISTVAHRQVVRVPDPSTPTPAGALPPGSGHATPAQLEALIAAINSADTVELQRLILTPHAKTA